MCAPFKWDASIQANICQSVHPIKRLLGGLVCNCFLPEITLYWWKMPYGLGIPTSKPAHAVHSPLNCFQGDGSLFPSFQQSSVCVIVSFSDLYLSLITTFLLMMSPTHTSKDLRPASNGTLRAQVKIITSCDQWLKTRISVTLPYITLTILHSLQNLQNFGGLYSFF